MAIQPPYVSSFQAADIILCGRLADYGADGQGANANGRGHVVAPFRGRVIQVMGACETGLSATTKRSTYCTGSILLSKMSLHFR